MHKLKCVTHYIFTCVHTHGPPPILESFLLHPSSQYPTLQGKYRTTSFSIDHCCLFLNFMQIKSFDTVLYLASCRQCCIFEIQYPDRCSSGSFS